MSEIILHHYDMSPYAEKIRLIFGYKGLAWRSVQIPIVMPKPDLTALTGGYRKTPVMQIGADIYCDTKVIARKLEQLHPDPPLFASASAAAERALTLWSDALFTNVVTIFFGEDDVFDEAFLADRQKLVPGGVDTGLARAAQPSKLAQLRANLELLERQLDASSPYLLGERLGIADLCVYHPLRFLDRTEVTRRLLEERPSIGRWLARIDAVGHGERSELDGAEAVRIARDAEPAVVAEPTVAPGDPSGIEAGAAVNVLPEDYGRDPVGGVLVSADALEIAIRRHDERAGDVVVHFPREDFLCFAAT